MRAHLLACGLGGRRAFGADNAWEEEIWSLADPFWRDWPAMTLYRQFRWPQPSAYNIGMEICDRVVRPDGMPCQPGETGQPAGFRCPA
jgi:hypothetical protein